MTKKRLFVEIAKSEVLSIFEIHIAMALTMRKDYAEMSAMYGYTLATTLSRLKKKNVVFQNKRGNWELNTNTEEWHELEAPPKKETNKNGKLKTKAINQDLEREATLDMMAELEQKLNELKEKIA